MIDPLEASDGSLWLRPEVAVDVREFADTATAVLDGVAAASRRRTLHALIGQDLLMGWYDDWVLLERERLRELRLHALEALSAQLLTIPTPR